MPRDRKAEMLLSHELQTIARKMERTLKKITGEDRTPFVLVIQVHKNAQYVANVQREDGKGLLRTLLTRWEQGLPDVPEHEKH